MKRLFLFTLLFFCIIGGIVLVISGTESPNLEIQPMVISTVDSNTIDDFFDEDELDPHTFDSSGNLLRRESNE